MVSLVEQQPARVEVRRDVGVGLLHEPPVERSARERAVERDRLEEHQPLVATERVVLLAERGGDVHHARAVVGGDELRADDAAVRRFAGLDELRAAVDERQRLDALPLARLVERRVAQADERRALEAREHGLGRGVGKDGAQARRGDDEPPVAVLDERVLGIGRDGEGGVARQRPRRRGPREHRGRHAVGEAQCVVGPGVRVGVEKREEHGHARVGRVVLVAERDLVARQTGAAARAVRGDAVVPEDKVVLPEPLQHPPARTRRTRSSRSRRRRRCRSRSRCARSCAPSRRRNGTRTRGTAR